MNPLQKEIGFFDYFKSRFWIFIFNQCPNHSSFDEIRCFFLKMSGINIENKIKVFSPLRISPKTRTKNIVFKGPLFINSNSRFSVLVDCKIIINKNCLIGPNVIFETVSHGLVYKDNQPRGAILGNIIIEEGVWIGSNSILLQNVNVGKGVVIAAASLVNKDVESFTMVGGIPIKKIKKINE